MATTLQRKSRLCAFYPTPYQSQKSPTGHQPIFYSRSHQGLLKTANKFHCTKKSFLINHCSNGRALLRRHFNASQRLCALYPTPYQGLKSPTGYQPIFYPRSHQGLLITANKFRCTKNLSSLTIAQTDVFYGDDTSTQVATMRYPTPHQGQISSTSHKPIFYPRSHQGPVMTTNTFRCTKQSFVINHYSNGRVLWRRHFNASSDYALPHTTSRPKVAYWSSAHILLKLPPRAPHNSQQV